MTKVETVVLSDQQAAVALAPLDERQLVIAPAGTGKTHTLIERLRFLVEECDLSPGRDLLVLSFSRAAVREIRDRVRADGGDVSHVRAITFDSYATRLLAEVDPNGAWTTQSYDGRIVAAVGAIGANPEALEILSTFEHILIDELQDVVGPRADLVRGLLEGTDCGFTLLGDPAQAIYNYQLEGSARTLGSDALFAWVRKHFASDLRERSLGNNYRVNTDLARRCLRAGDELAKPTPDYERARSLVDSCIADLDTLPNLAALSLLSARPDAGRTAVLCRTNGQALVISQALSHLKIPHTLQRDATDRAVAPWVARCLTGVEASTVGRAFFDDRYAEKVADRGPEPDEAWELLTRVTGRRKGGLELARLSDRIRNGILPDELTDTPSSSLTVSTIHRGKGREYETVVLVAGRIAAADEDAETFAEETRVMHVGLTRAKQTLFLGDEPKVSGYLYKNKSDRWTRRGYKRFQRWGFEVRPGDVEETEPPGARFLNATPTDIQEALWSSVTSGDVVDLRLRLGSNDSGEPRAFYGVFHNDRPIGLTTESFSTALFYELRVFPGWEVRWPQGLSDVYIDGIETAAGSVASGQRAGLGSSGLWLKARIIGLANIDWSKEAK